MACVNSLVKPSNFTPYILVSFSKLKHSIKELNSHFSLLFFTSIAICFAYDGTQKGAYVKKGVSIVYLESPSNLSAKNVEGGVRISFSSVTGAERYRVYRKVKGEKNFYIPKCSAYVEKIDLINKEIIKNFNKYVTKRRLQTIIYMKG